MSFPASPTSGQQATVGGRLYAWNGSNAWELVANVAGHAATHATGSSDALTASSIGAAASSHAHTAADIASGTLSDSLLSSNVVLTTDSRLTNSRSPTAHASSHATGGSDAITASSIGAAASSHTHDAAGIVSGTLADSLLSANVPLLPGMMLPWGQPSGTVDTVWRNMQTPSFNAGSSGQVFFCFFTPLATVTVSQITMASGTPAASGLTLCRMGIFTTNETAVTLIARTASDTTLFASTQTAYTRSLATAGGYPSTVTLTAGTRYGVGVIQVGTTPAGLCGVFNVAPLAGLSPRTNGSSSGQSDLGNLSSFTNQTWMPFARLS